MLSLFQFPKSWARNVNLLVLLNAPLSVPVATGVNYTSFVLTGFVFRQSSFPLASPSRVLS